MYGPLKQRRDTGDEKKDGKIKVREEKGGQWSEANNGFTDIMEKRGYMARKRRNGRKV